MLIEQAIFTSAESDHAVGYHLAARSPGLDERDARELSVWGPSHDSLESASAATAVSVNFFRLPSGAYCVSKTQLAGAEYSGRGLRTYTSCLVVPPPVLGSSGAGSGAGKVLLPLPLPLLILSISNWPPATFGATAMPAKIIATPKPMALKAEKPSVTVLPPQTKSRAKSDESR